MCWFRKKRIVAFKQLYEVLNFNPVSKPIFKLRNPNPLYKKNKKISSVLAAKPNYFLRNIRFHNTLSKLNTNNVVKNDNIDRAHNSKPNKFDVSKRSDRNPAVANPATIDASTSIYFKLTLFSFPDLAARSLKTTAYFQNPDSQTEIELISFI